MPRVVTVEKNTVIDAPVDDVWKISATDFEHIHRWDANVRDSRSTGGGAKGGRVCDQYNGRKTTESLVDYDESRYTFTYAIIEGLPGFVASARNAWTHEAVGTGSTKLTMRLVMQVEGILGLLMTGPMKLQMGKILSNAQAELKHFVETGQPHPRKRKKLA